MSRGFLSLTRMPLGLINTPATFQRALDIILLGVRYDFALVYLDDIIIFSRTFEEHLGHLTTVLTLLKEEIVSLKLSKCQFAREEIEYLSHVI